MRGHLLDRAHTTTLTLLRVAAGLLFMQHGVQKLFGWLGGDKVGDVVSLMGLAGVIETFGGALLVIGLLTRPVAFLMAGQMVVAYFMAHASQSPWPIQNQGELALLYAVIFLFFAARGAGPLSVDALVSRKRHGSERGTAPRRWEPVEHT